jgi:hypothetical protein
LWQTFTDLGIDIDLDSSEIRAEIGRHLSFLAEQRIWGIRLDAAAYYAKPKLASENVRHHPETRRIAREIVGMIEAHALAPIAQLDCDEWGAPYFPAPAYSVPIVDYSYAAYLTLALLSADGKKFAEHVTATDRLGVTLIRYPRTHDGILLRSGFLPPDIRSGLVESVTNLGISCRIIDGGPYEFNCSLPYLLSLDRGRDVGWHRIELAVAISCFVSGWAFLFLPILLNFMPEMQTEDVEPRDDPRYLNRLPVPLGVWRSAESSDRAESMWRLLDVLAASRYMGSPRDRANVSAADGFDGHVILIDRPLQRVRLIANISSDSSAKIDPIASGALFAGWRASSDVLAPCGFGIWRY